MWQSNKDKQNSRRMSGALLCAALLHVVLFFALDRFARFPDTSLSSDRGTVTRIQLRLPQAQPESKLQTADKIESYHSQPKDQVERDASGAEQPAKEISHKSAEPVVETIREPAPASPTEQNEASTEAGPQQNQAALTKAEKSIRDTSGDSPSKSIPNDSENKSKTESISSEQPYQRRAAEGTPQVSNQEPASHQEFTVYLQQLIEEKRRYPRAARRRNIEGAVEFSVHVSRAGDLAELTLNSSSGSRILDKAAEDLLERVFPVDYPLQENVRTTVRIIYKLTEV